MYDAETGRGLLTDYAVIRAELVRVLELVRAAGDETGQRPMPVALVEAETILGRVIGAMKSG